MRKVYCIVWLALWCVCSPALRAADVATDGLPPLFFMDKPSVLQGVVNDLTLRGDTLSLFYSSLTGFRDEDCVIDEKGEFRIELSIGYPTEVRMGFSSFMGQRISVFLTPGEVTEVKIEQRSQKLYYQYSGSFARVNEEFANRAIHTSLFPDLLKVGEVPSVKNIASFRDYLYGKYKRIVEMINARADLSAATKRLIAMQRQVELFSILKDAPYHLARAGIMPDHSAVISTNLPDSFFLPLQGLPSLSDSSYMYCLEYAYFANQIQTALPLFDDAAQQKEMFRKGLISEEDYKLLCRLADLSNIASIDSFSEGEKARLYQCVQLKDRYVAGAKDRYWQTLFGTDYHFISEYWSVLDRVEQIYSFTPLTAAQKDEMQKWSTPWFCERVLAFDSLMSARKVRGLSGDSIRIDPLTKNTCRDDLFYSFYKRHKGSPVLLVFWESWLDSEGTTLRNLQPLKEKLEQQGVKVVYIASEYSPYNDWRKLINNVYTGRHIRVTRNQIRYLRNEYSLNSLPVFFLIDKEGVVQRRFADLASVRALIK